jgi:hypothetical protein
MKKMYTKRHFENIAKLIKNSKSTTILEFFAELINEFKKDNPKFKMARFLKASGLEKAMVQLKDYDVIRTVAPESILKYNRINSMCKVGHG